jgi:hypothetical protein
MFIDGIQLSEGSALVNATVASGASFPGNPNIGELFYKTETDAGLKVYDGTSWTAVGSGEGGGGGSGSVTSVAATVPAFLSVSGSPITSSGTLAISLSGTALPIANGGTGATSAGAALTALGGASLSSQNTYTASQIISPATLTSGGTVNVNAALSNNFRLVLGTNATLANPTNLTNGQVFNVIIIQDGAGGRTLGYGNKYKFVGGVAPSLSVAPNSVDVLGCYYDGTLDIILCNLNKTYA